MLDDLYFTVNAARASLGKTPLTAAGVPGKGNENWRHQLRDKYGKWIEMGGLIKWSIGGVFHTGKVTGFDGDYVVADMKNGKSGAITHGVKVHKSQVEAVEEKATLDPSVTDGKWSQEQKQKLDAAPKDIVGNTGATHGYTTPAGMAEPHFPFDTQKHVTDLKPGDKIFESTQEPDGSTTWEPMIVTEAWAAAHPASGEGDIGFKSALDGHTVVATFDEHDSATLDNEHARAILESVGAKPYTGADSKKADVPEQPQTPVHWSDVAGADAQEVPTYAVSSTGVQTDLATNLNVGDKVSGMGGVHDSYVTMDGETYVVEKSFLPTPSKKPVPYNSQHGVIQLRRESDGQVFDVGVYRQTTVLRAEHAPKPQAPEPAPSPAPNASAPTHDDLLTHAMYAQSLVDEFGLSSHPEHADVGSRAIELEQAVNADTPNEIAIRQASADLAAALDDFDSDANFDLTQDQHDRISESVADLEDYVDAGSADAPSAPAPETPAPAATPAVAPASPKSGIIQPADDHIVTADDVQPGDKILEITAHDNNGNYKTTGEVLEVTKAWQEKPGTQTGVIEFRRSDGTVGAQQIDRFDDVVLADGADVPAASEAPAAPDTADVPNTDAPLIQTYGYVDFNGERTVSQIDALRGYANYNYTTINKSLRDGTDPSADGQWHIDNINSALAQSSLNQNLDLYRGVKDIGVFNGELVPGAVVRDKAYLSTTHDLKTAESFAGKKGPGKALTLGGAVFHFNAPKGTHALDVDHVAAIKNDPETESEILLPPGTPFTIDSVQKDNFGIWRVEAHISTPEELNNANAASPAPAGADLPGGAPEAPGGAPNLDQPGPGHGDTPASGPAGEPTKPVVSTSYGLTRFEGTQLSETEQSVVYQYTGVHYNDVNTGLRTGQWPDPGPKDMADTLQEVLDKSTLIEDVKLHRGVKNADFLPDKLEPGTVITDKGFMSASSDEEVASMFIGPKKSAIFHFVAPKGTHAFDVEGLQQNGEAESENEFILKPGSGLRVISDKYEHGERHIEAEYVPPEENIGAGQVNTPPTSESTPPDVTNPKSFHVLDDPGTSGDGYFPGTHLWGKYGAAGVMLRHVDENGQDRYLLVQRGPIVSSNKGKWQLPGGALNSNENDYQGTARELVEELSPPQDYLSKISPKGEVLFEHPTGWHYNNITADVPEQFDPVVDGTETGDAKWFTGDEIMQMHADGKLHPAFGDNLSSIFDAYDTPGQAPQVEQVDTPEAAKIADEAVVPVNDVPNENSLVDVSKWKKVGSQAGSNPGGVYEAPDGTRYYIKQSQTEDHARNEVLARKLYDLTGINSAKLDLVDVGGGKLGTASPLIPDAKPDLKTHLDDPAYLHKLQEGFATDAWLANWDVAGLVFDNVVTDANGDPWRVDPGGALEYRAQGAPKGAAWGDKVGELDTLKTAQQAGKLFGDMDPATEKASAERVAAVTDEQIDSAVDSTGFTGQQADELKSTLKARRDYIANHYGLTAPDAAPTPDATSAPTPEFSDGWDEKPLADMTEAEAALEQSAGAILDALDTEGMYHATDGLPLPYGHKWTLPNGASVVVTREADPHNGDDGQVSLFYPDGKLHDKVDIYSLQASEAGRLQAQESLYEIGKQPALPAGSPTPELDLPPVPTPTPTPPAPTTPNMTHVDANGTEITLGATVKSVTDGKVYTVVKFEGNGTGVQVIGEDGKKYGRKKSKLVVVNKSDSATPEAPAQPTPNVPHALDSLPAVETARTWSPQPGESFELLPGDKPFMVTNPAMGSKTPEPYVYSPSSDTLYGPNGEVYTGGKNVISSAVEVSGVTIEPVDTAPNAPEAPSAPNIDVNGPSALDSKGTKIYVGSKVKSTTDGKVYTVVKFEGNGTGVQVTDESGKKYGRKLKKLEAIDTPPPAPTETPGLVDEPSTPPSDPGPEPGAKLVGTFVNTNDMSMDVHEGDTVWEVSQAAGPSGEKSHFYVVEHPNKSVTTSTGYTTAPESDVIAKLNAGGLSIAKVYQTEQLPSFTKPGEAAAQLHTGPSAPDAYGKPIYVGSKVKSLSDGKIYSVVKFESNGTGVQVLGPDGKKYGRKLKKLAVVDGGANAPAPGTPVSDAEVDKFTPNPVVSDLPLSVVIKPTGGTPDALDPNSPWFEQPQPTPPDVTASTPWVTEQWVSDAKAAYLAWPEKKGKPLEDSYNWSRFKKVMEQGSLADLEHLNMKGYFSQNPELYAQAKQSIESATVANATKKAEFEAAHAKYVSDLHDWKVANGLDLDPTTISGMPEPSTDPFMGGEADWSKAHPGTPTLESALAAIAASNDVATHGASFAGDSDQIEDLDVRITKFVDTDGTKKLHVQFKTTAWAGDELAPYWEDTGTTVSGLTVPIMQDNGDGLRKRLKVSLSDAGDSTGVTYVMDDKASGAQIKVHRGHRAGHKQYKDGKQVHAPTVMNDHTTQNLVQIDLPENATPDDIASALKRVGIRDARPSTEDDVRRLAENRMMSIFGNSTDPTKNTVSANLRAKKLAEIKEKYGITIDDLYLAPGVRGRMRLMLSDQARDKLIAKTNVSGFRHNVSSPHLVDRWESILTGQMSGLQPTSVRWLEGNGETGSSSSSDWDKGSAEWLFTKPVHGDVSNTYGSGYVMMHPAAMMRRTDVYGNQNDDFGARSAHKDVYNVISNSGAYEVTWKHGVPVSDFWYINVDDNVRDELIKRLKSRGITSINGIPIGDFILAPGMPVPEVDPSTWSSGALQPLSNFIGQTVNNGGPDVSTPISTPAAV